MKIYHCEDSLEGIFTAIYNTYEDHCIIRDTMVTTIEENLLFSEVCGGGAGSGEDGEGDPDIETHIWGGKIMRACVWLFHPRSRKRPRRYTVPLQRGFPRSVRRDICWMPWQTRM